MKLNGKTIVKGIVTGFVVWGIFGALHLLGCGLLEVIAVTAITGIALDEVMK